MCCCKNLVFGLVICAVIALVTPQGADRVAGQLRGDKECPFSGKTKSGGRCRKAMLGVCPLNRFSKLDRSPYPINCDQELPRKCSHDFTPHCLKGRKEPVFGHCEFQDAVCDEGAEYDPSQSCDLH